MFYIQDCPCQKLQCKGKSFTSADDAFPCHLQSLQKCAVKLCGMRKCLCSTLARCQSIRLSFCLSGQYVKSSAARMHSVLALQKKRLHSDILHRALHSHRQTVFLKASLFRNGVNKQFVLLRFNKTRKGAVLHQAVDFLLRHGKAGRPWLHQTLSDRFSCAEIQIHLQKQQIRFNKSRTNYRNGHCRLGSQCFVRVIIPPRVILFLSLYNQKYFIAILCDRSTHTCR